MKNKLSNFFAKIGAKINPILSAGWNTTKKVGKKFLGFLGGLFIIAAKYGAAAITGLAGGLIAGLPFAIKGGLAVGGAVTGATSFLGPLAPVAGAASGVITFFTIEAGFGAGGLGAGIVVQNLIDKITAFTSQNSLPQMFSQGLAQTTKAAVAKAGGQAIIGGTAVLTITTILNYQLTTGAFFQEGLGEIKESIGIVVPARPYDEAGHLAEKVIYTLQECGLTHVRQDNWQRVVSCLESSPLPNTTAIIKEFKHSVFQITGPGLQCVGFVRGIMDALNRDLGQRYHSARGYLNRPEDSLFYAINGDAGQAQNGDLMIMRGYTDGHIAIMVEWREDKILVAQAFGPSGFISLELVNPYYFDGFLRPK